MLCISLTSAVYRTYELQVNGGTPYEKNVELETSVRRGCKKKQVQSKSETIKYHLHLLSSISSSPLLSSWCFPADASGQASAETDREVEVHQQSDQNPAQVRRPLTRTETRQTSLTPSVFSVQSHLFVFFSLLPETLLHCLNCVHLLALHRQLLADTLLMDRPTMQNAGDTHTNTHFTVHYIYI